MAGRFVDAYRVLGVPPEATAAELKAAHRRLVRAYHPDLRPPEERAEATRVVQEVNLAYGLVRDPSRRVAYDRLRRAHLAHAAAASKARRAGEAVAGVDEALAAQWQAALTSAGRWAGRWWRRNRALVRRAGVRAQLAGTRARRAWTDALGRVLWLATALAGAWVGLAVATAAGRLGGVEGVLGPLAGALTGLGIGSWRGWCRRLRMAGLGDRDAELRGTVFRLALAGAVVAGALALDARLAS